MIKAILPISLLLTASVASGQILSWGPSTDILENRFVSIQNSTTSTPAGTINGSVNAEDDPAGTFRYRSHLSAIITNQTYDVAPPSPDFGWAMAAWTPTTAPSVFTRIDGRGEGNDYIQLSNSTSGSTYTANLVWWALAAPEDATARAVSTQVQTSGGTFALMVRNGTQWYIGEANQVNVADLTTLNFVAYNPVDGVPVSLYANNPSGDTVGSLSDLTFDSVTLNNITAMGLYHERIGTNNFRNMQISEFTVIPEPSTYATLFGLGALGLFILRRRILR